MQSLGVSILNGTIALENSINDQVYLKEAINNLRNSTGPRLPEKIDEKELTLENANEILTGRQRL